MSTERTAPDTASPEVSVDEAIEQAKRAYALKNFEQAVEYYASALELMTKKYGDASPDCVDLYFAYGKALLENAIAQNSVLGKEETTAALDGDEIENNGSGSGANASDARIHFGEDAILEDENDDTLGAEEPEREEKTVDLFAEVAKAESGLQGEGENAESGDEEGDGEPEDDFNAAWEVLEVARSLYEGQKDSDDEAKLKLADTYIALGDVSLETEKLDQAVSDYTAAVTLKTELLPLSSRQIAEAHYKLCIVYDMTAGRLAHAIEHAKKAESSVQARLNEITTRLKSVSVQDDVQQEAKPDAKGKGKVIATKFPSETRVEDMSKTQLESEIKELQGLLEDVSLKIEELKTSPDAAEGSAPDLVAQELDRDLNGVAASSAPSGKVNDLTSMVIKKKKKAPDPSGEKRKADEDVTGPLEKKPKVDAAAV